MILVVWMATGPSRRRGRLVAASETVTDGATFHFALDPAVACSEYPLRTQAPNALVRPRAEGWERVGTSRRAA